jgi:hypothetical protein
MKSKKAFWVALGLAAVLILVIAVSLSSDPSQSTAPEHFSKNTDSDTDWSDDMSGSRPSDAEDMADMADEDSSSASAADKSEQQEKFLRALRTLQANSQAIARAGDFSFRQRLQNNDRTFQGMMANSQAFNATQAARVEQSQINARNTEDAMHAGAQQTINSVLDQQQYVNPYNGQIITLGNQFNRAWAANDGSLAGTTGNADPNDYTVPGSPAYTQAPTRY